MVLLKRQMSIHPDAQPTYCLCIELYGLVSDSYLCCQLWPEVLLVAPSAREQRRLRLCSVELSHSSACPLSALCSASLKYRDDMVDIASSRHPGKDVPKE